MSNDGASTEDLDSELLVKTRILGDAQHGLTVDEIAKLLWLQESTVKIYLRNDKRRIDLYRRLFVEDEGVKERATRILEERRAARLQREESRSWRVPGDT